METILSIAQQK